MQREAFLRRVIKAHVLPRLSPTAIVVLKQAEVVLRCGLLGLYYEGEERPFLKMINDLKDKGCVLDIGANQGQYAIPLARLSNCSRLIAVEPQSALVESLRRVAKWLRLANVDIVASFVGDRAGRAAMGAVPRNYAGTQERFMVSSAEAEEESYCVMTLDEIAAATCAAEDKVIALKIDVEGAELKVLRGASATIGRWRPIVLVELIEPNLKRYGDSLYAVSEWAVENGYEVWRLAGDGLSRTSLGQGRSDLAPSNNYFLLPKATAMIQGDRTEDTGTSSR